MEKTLHIHKDSGSEAQCKCTGDERFDTKMCCRRRRNWEKKKSDIELRDMNSEPENYSDLYDSGESESRGDCGAKPNRKSGQSHRCKIKNHRRISRQNSDSSPHEICGDSSLALSELLKQSSYRRDVNSNEGEHRPRRRRSKFQVARPLNELFARVADYHGYKLVQNKTDYQDLLRHLRFSEKTIDVKVRPQSLPRSELVVVLSFLEKFKNSCTLCNVPGSIEVWLYEISVRSQKKTFLQIRPRKIWMAADSKKANMFQTDRDALSSLLSAYTTDEVIAETYRDVTILSQNLAMTEETYFPML